MGRAVEFKTHPEANYNPFPVKYYCYYDDCPGRTKDDPCPKQDGTYRYIKVKSKKGNFYYRKRWVCDHCGRVMTGTVSMYVFG